MSIDISTLGPDAQRQIMERDTHIDGAWQAHSKYHAQKAGRGGIVFDSKKEAVRYDELMILYRAGSIRNLRIQPQYTLLESYVTPEGERIRGVKYVADFDYDERVPDAEDGDPRWRKVVEDVKSTITKTPQYILKRKMLRDKYGISIREV